MSKDKKLKFLPKNNSTATVYELNYRRLLTIAANVFKWLNLPPSLPQWEIEQRLFRQGFTVIFKHKDYGIVTSDGSIYGVNIYNHANKFTYAQPVLGSGNGSLGVSGVCIYNTDIDSNITEAGAAASIMGDLLKWFARMLTDIEVSITLLTLKSRHTNAVVANTDTARNALTEFFKKSEQGDINVPFAPATMFDNITDLVQHAATNAVSITDLLQLQSQIMRDFYATFGVQTVQHKSERLISDEINSDTDFLAANVDNMLKCRQRAAAEINKIFGTNIAVEVNYYVT